MAIRWTEGEILALKQNWTIPVNMKKLQLIINRTPGSIYEQARIHDLPMLSYSEAYGIRHNKEIKLQQKLFLKEFKEQRNEKRARLKIGLAYNTIRKWVNRDLEFVQEYKIVQGYILSTKRCIYCNKVDDKNQFRNENDEKRRNWSTGICKKCDSDRIMRFNTRSMENRIHTIWKQTKSKRIGPGRNTAVISDLTLDELMKLYKKQNGLCYYTGDKMIHKSDILRDPKLISLDRKIPENGYTIDNVVFCCWEINQMKSKKPYDEFIKVCKLISDRFF